LFENYLICCGLGYLVALIACAVALIQASIIRFAKRNSLPKYLTTTLKVANGVSAMTAFFGLGTLAGQFLRSGGDLYRLIFASSAAIGLGIFFFAIRELDGLRQSN
jgi:hypothetical protein